MEVARPLLLELAPALVLGVGGRVALEAVRVHLQDGGALGAHVVDDGAPRLHRVLEAAAVHLDAGHAVVLALPPQSARARQRPCERATLAASFEGHSPVRRAPRAAS